MTSNQIKIGVSVVLLLLSAFLIWRHFAPSEGAQVVQHYVGTVAGTEALNYLGEDARVVLIGFEGDRPVMKKLMKGFGDTLEAGGGEVIGHAYYDPTGPDGRITEAPIPPEFFRETFRNNREADAFVSFIGPPPVVLLRKMGEKRPPLIVVGDRSQRLPMLVNKGLIDLGIGSRRIVAQHTQEPAATYLEWFDRYYEVYRKPGS